MNPERPHFFLLLALLGTASVLPSTALAADDGWGDFEPPPQKTFDTHVYGFIDSYAEKVAQTPYRNDAGETAWESNPYEFDVLNFNVMVQGSVHGKYRYFFNLAAPGAGGASSDQALGVRNAWVEAPLAGSLLSVRAGKMYRRFGLYNEVLDAVPTFIGIEPPELFDKDHLMLTRTTNLMLMGSVPVGDVVLNYSVSTGNDERSPGSIPVGVDVFVDVMGSIKVGSSFYTTGGSAGPSHAVGDGSPRGGVANWMAEDNYKVFGGYAQVNAGGFIGQAEFWQADHDATRDEASVAMLADADLNDRQLDRFFTGGDPTKGPAALNVQYSVRTAYVRAGYQVPIGKNASITPYGQADYYSNPETISQKDFGGDSEAGISDDGAFFKYTLGAVIRPVPQVALKLDGSAHQMQFNGETVFFPEARVSLSYMWQLKD